MCTSEQGREARVLAPTFRVSPMSSSERRRRIGDHEKAMQQLKGRIGRETPDLNTLGRFWHMMICAMNTYPSSSSAVKG